MNVQKYRGDGSTTRQLQSMGVHRPVLYICPSYQSVGHIKRLARDLGINIDGVIFQSVEVLERGGQKLRGVKWKQIILDHAAIPRGEEEYEILRIFMCRVLNS